MDFSYGYVNELYARHTAWRLLRLEHAPLIISFLYRTYIEPNRRMLRATDFTRLLDDDLHALRHQHGDESFRRSGEEYLADWVSKDLLRKYYEAGSDEPCVDLKAATEKAIHWVVSLKERRFVGTESRLRLFVDLLREMAEESSGDQGSRLAALQKQREALQEKIARAEQGDVDVLSDSELRDRFQQLTQLAYGLLADFREVEHNFRQLSRSTRERIAMWDGSKGSLLDELWRSRDEISDSDEGRSFEAFCSFLLSPSGQDELSALLSTTVGLPAIAPQVQETRLERVHYDWIAAGEATQRTVASLSQQLRRFLDDQASLENRRIMDILHKIESHALALRDAPVPEDLVWMDERHGNLNLPMDRPMFRPPVRLQIESSALEQGQAASDADALYSQVAVDRVSLAERISAAIAENGPVTLRELTELQPLRHGLTELVTYLDLGSSRFEMQVLDFMKDSITWTREHDGHNVERHATMQRVLFKEKSA